MSKIRDHLDKAREMEQSATHWYLGYSREVQEEIHRATGNLNLSPEGRQKAAGKVRKAAELMLLRKSHQLKQQYLRELNSAKKDAEETINRRISKPQQSDIDEFSSRLGRLKTSLSLATRPETATKLLDEFVSSINDPYFANLTADNFGDLSAQVINVADGDKQTKIKLGQVFDHLQYDFASDELKDVRQFLPTLNEMTDDGSVFSLAVVNNVNGLFDSRTASAINKPEEFFTDDKAKWIAEDGEDYRVTNYAADEYFRETGEQDLNDQLAGKLML